MDEDFDYWYDWGWRRGVIYKASGLEPLDISGWNEYAQDGWNDGQNSTERRL